MRRRFTRRYVAALVVVAGAAGVGQEGIRDALQQQVSNSQLVNVAGRQRMLSQRIAKGALAVRAGLDTADRLVADVDEWQDVHRALLEGDRRRGLPRVEEPHLRATLDSLTSLVEQVRRAGSALGEAAARGDAERADELVQEVLDAEAQFLPAMDRVVFGLDAQAAADLRRVRHATGLVLLFFLGGLVAVAGLVVRPAVRRVAEAVDDLDGQRRLLRTVIDTIPDHIYVKDTGARATLRNLASARALGFDDPEEAVGRTDADDGGGLGKEALNDDLRVLSTREAVRNKAERGLDGGWLLTTKVPLLGSEGEVVGLVGVSRDVTAAKEAELEVRAMAERLALLVRNLAAGTLLEDERGRVLVANPSFCALFGLDASPEALVGECRARVFAEAAAQATDASAFRAFTEAVARDRQPASGAALALANGRVLDWEFSPVRLDGAHAGHLWRFRDVTEQRELETRLFHQAHHDSLTGLPNRALLTTRLEMAVAQRHAGGRYALLYADLDGFKAINDSLGHSVGDRLLCTVAARLREAVRPSDTVARLGGDEFAVLLDGVPDDAYAEAVAERIRVSVAAPASVDGHDLSVGISVGVVPGRTDHRDPDAVLLEADRAMYRAKAAAHESAAGRRAA